MHGRQVQLRSLDSKCIHKMKAQTKFTQVWWAVWLAVNLAGLDTPGAAAGERVEEVVSARLMLAFQEDCDQISAATRVLRSWITHRTGFGNVGAKSVEGSDQDAFVQFDSKVEGDYDAYQRMRINVNHPLYAVSSESLALEEAGIRRCSIENTTLKKVGIAIVDFQDCPAIVPADLKAAFEEDACIAAVELDSLVTMMDEPIELTKSPTQIIANPDPQPDPENSTEDSSYWLDIVKIPEARMKSQCNRSTVIGIIDSGVEYTHPRLRCNMWVNPGEIPWNGIDDDGNGFIDDVIGYDFLNRDAYPLDEHGHGTHVAGIIGAASTTPEGYGCNRGNENYWLTRTTWEEEMHFIQTMRNKNSHFSPEGPDYATESSEHADTDIRVPQHLLNRANAPNEGTMEEEPNEQADADAVQGVCGEISLAALRFMDSTGTGTTSAAIEAINYSYMMGFQITNNSWGGPGGSTMLRQAVGAAGKAGQLFVAAAGNSNRNTDHVPHYPSSYSMPHLIAVGATDQSDNLARFSNYGANSVHIAAPGVRIVSTYPPSTYKALSGTSMSVPIVAGVAAMLMAKRKVPPSSLVWVIVNSCDPLQSNANPVLGGRLNAEKALHLLEKMSLLSDSSYMPDLEDKTEQRYRWSLFLKAMHDAMLMLIGPLGTISDNPVVTSR